MRFRNAGIERCTSSHERQTKSYGQEVDSHFRQQDAADFFWSKFRIGQSPGVVNEFQPCQVEGRVIELSA
jgi:hypothetical protein